MSDLMTSSDLAHRLELADLTPREFCKFAGIAPSLFYRWRSGETTPNMRTYKKIVDALKTLEDQ